MPVRLRLSPEKVETPLVALIEVVPDKVADPGFDRRAIETAAEDEVTVFPALSRMAICKAGEKTEPAVELLGCWRKAS